MRNRVRALRTAAGLSQEAIAGELRVTRQTINAIECGRYGPTLVLAVKIARRFGATVEEVFFVDDDQDSVAE